MNKIYDESIANIRQLLQKEKIYISVDGTSSDEISVGAFVVGSLENPHKGPFLIKLCKMNDGTAESYFQLILEGLNVLYENSGE